MIGSRRVFVLCCAAIVSAALGGCGGETGTGRSAAGSFTLAWSEYPSWSVFGVAHEQGLIDGDQGELGAIESKWGVDIVLKEVDYDTCITMYGSATCDAVCITNMDILSPSLGRESVAVLPTSTSDGADACVVVGIDDVRELRNHKVYGLDKSVSEYTFVRNLELLGEKESDHQFTSRDPAAAALSLQTNQVKAIVVWNPFVLQTLKQNRDAKVLFDSSKIPGEIIDMVVVAKQSLERPGGKEFACAVIDTFYALNRRLADPAAGDATLVALGAKFSSLGLEEMKTVVQQTRFYRTPDAGLGLFTSAGLPEIMKKVMGFCISHGMVTSEPKVGYGGGAAAPGVQLLFDPSYMRLVQAKLGAQ